MPIECLKPPQLSQKPLESPQSAHVPSRRHAAPFAGSDQQGRGLSRADHMDAPQFKTDEFRMLVMKVQPCSKRFCHDWTVCPFAHPGEKARRRDPRNFNYTGIACPDMKKDNSCPRGEACPYAHNVFEYWLHPTRYRTQLCNDGERCNRPVCFFAHTLVELRVPAVKPFVPPEALAAASMEASRISQPQAQAQGRPPDADPDSLAAQLAWLRLGGGLDVHDPSGASHVDLQHSLDAQRFSFGDPRLSMGDHALAFGDPRHSAGDHRASGDQLLHQQAASYLAQLQQQQHLHQQQQQQHLQQPQEQPQESEQAPQQQQQQHAAGSHVDFDLQDRQAMSSPHSLHDSMVRARSKSDPLGLRAGLPTVPGQQQPLQQQEAPPAGPADGAPRIQGRSLDEALRTLRQMQQQQPAGLWGSGLGGRLDEDATRYDPLDMHDWQQEQHQHEQHNQHNQHPPQQQPENSWASPYPSVEAFFTHSRASLPYQQHRSASGSSSRHAFAQHQQFGAPSSSTVLQDLTSGGLPSVRDSSSHDSGSGHEMRNSHSHSQESPRAFGMLWGSQSRRAPQSAAEQRRPSPLRSSFNQTFPPPTRLGAEQVWDSPQQQQPSYRRSSATTRSSEQDRQSYRSSVSSSRASAEVCADPQAGNVPDYSHWLMPPAGGHMQPSGGHAQSMGAHMQAPGTIPEAGYPDGPTEQQRDMHPTFSATSAGMPHRF